MSAESPGLIRLEYIKGTSKKFWEADMKNKVLVTRWGRIGTKGQEKKKKFENEWQASDALRELVKDKRKKGYAEAKTAQELEFEKPPAKKSKDNAALEAAILKDLDDPKAWLVYADWLQAEGDPRGELIVVQQTLEDTKSRKLEKREEEILKEHGAALLGSLRNHAVTIESEPTETFEWKRGFIHKIRISYNHFTRGERKAPLDMKDVLADALKHPSAKFVQEIVLAQYTSEKWDKKRSSNQIYEYLTDVIAKAKPKALRKLVIGEYEFPDDTEISWTYIGNFSKIWKACPRLESIVVQGGKMDPGKIDAPNLKDATFITGGLPGKALKSIASASWPKIEALHIWFGQASYGASGKIQDIQPILDAKGLPKLEHLGLINSEMGDDIAERLGRSKILKQLETLDLSRGTMTDIGAEAILADVKAFKHLTSLDLQTNYIASTDLTKKLVKAFGAKVNIGGQRDEGDYGRYAAVGE